VKTWAQQRTWKGMRSAGDMKDLPEGMVAETVNLSFERPGMVRKRCGLQRLTVTAASGALRSALHFTGVDGREWWVVADSSGAINAIARTVGG
jgi:hypothetical protein